VRVLAPVAGVVRPISEAPDPVFAAEMVGSGVAIDPDGGPQVAVAPLDGRIAKVHPHAYVLASPGGVGVLVHLGIDTVRLEGEGFEILTPSTGKVAAGQDMIRWDPSAVAAKDLSPWVLVCQLDSAPGTVTSPVVGQHVQAGDVLFEIPDVAAGRRVKGAAASD